MLNSSTWICFLEGRESSVLTRQLLLEGRGLGPDDRTEDFDVGDGLDGGGLLQFGVEAGVGLTDQVICRFSVDVRTQ